MERNSLFGTQHDGRKIKQFSIDIEGEENIFDSEKYDSMLFSGSFHGEYDSFFIVVNGKDFYSMNKVNWFEFE